MIDRIIIGCDHGGYEAKLSVIKHLTVKGLDVTDVGCQSSEIVRYPY